MKYEENERIRALKEQAINTTQEICVERARLLTEAIKKHQEKPIIVRRALAMENILKKMSIFILPGELVVGNQASSLRAAPIYPEYGASWVKAEIDDFDKRPADTYFIPQKDKKEIVEIIDWWEGKTVQDRAMSTIPDEVKQAYDIKVLSATGNMTSGDGHIMLDFGKILEVGVSGIVRECRNRLDNLDLTVATNVKKYNFLESVLITYSAVSFFISRFVNEAKRLAIAEKDAERKKELDTIAETCTAIAQAPPKTFREALQLTFFMHLISQIESNGHSMSLGRFDQYMYSYYQKDTQEGIISDKQVVELLSCLWIKMFGIVKLRPWNHTRFSGGGPTYQNLTLGGINKEGFDSTNELSYLCLDSVSITRLPQPNVSARFHYTSPRAFKQKCLEVISLGFGMPALHNDEMMIPSLLSRGIALEDANNYAIVGCIEPIIPGKHGYRAAGMSFTNFVKILEVTMNGGYDPYTKTKINDLNPPLREIKSFDELLESYNKQIKYFTRLRVTGEHQIDFAIEELVPEPFCSGLIQDCIARGLTPKEGGSVYDYVTGPETGITDAANSLAAIKKMVFDEKKLTMKELVDTLESDFAGVEGEKTRQLLLNHAEKFGNDDDEVDHLARKVYQMFIKEQEKYKTTRDGRGPIGCISYPCTATISGNVPSGIPIGATPDGRKAGSPLSEGGSPHGGTDIKGPTAVLKSVSKMPNMLITGGNLLNIKLNPATLQTESDYEKVEAMIDTFFHMKGWHVQFNVISAETLVEAQNNPEEYRDLVVRVAGYSAQFVNLEAMTQNDIISRTEHNV